MKKMLVVLSFLALSLGASAANSTPNVEEPCTVCTCGPSGSQCACSPDGCAAAEAILLEFLE